MRRRPASAARPSPPRPRAPEPPSQAGRTDVKRRFLNAVPIERRHERRLTRYEALRAAAQAHHAQVVPHERLAGGSRTFKAVDGSWPTILDLFRQELETGTVGLGTRVKLGLMGAFAFVLPRSLRTDVVEAHLQRHPPRLP